MGTFEAWAREVDELCVRHLACAWADLAGDLPPLQQAFEEGESPIQFVRWWAEKFDLEYLAPLPTSAAERTLI
jgi:hypothetical protein